MEEKMDALFDMVKNLTVEMSTVKTEMTSLKTEMSSFKTGMNSLETEMNSLKTEMNDRFDKIDERFDTLELKVDNLTSKSRGYNTEEKIDTHEIVLRKLSYQTNVIESKFTKLQEKLN